MEIIVLTTPTDAVVQACNKLLPQLTMENRSLTLDDLKSVMASCLFLTAVANNEIVGFLLLVTYDTLTGSKARIEDVVVDEGVRGQGIGEALLKKAIEEAHRKSIFTINLTSHPRRGSANRLYQRLGFEKYETNTYRYNVKALSLKA
jgi:ribosomal protein S18 acetylase RimI-like enzyme